MSKANDILDQLNADPSDSKDIDKLLKFVRGIKSFLSSM